MPNSPYSNALITLCYLKQRYKELKKEKIKALNERAEPLHGVSSNTFTLPVVKYHKASQMLFTVVVFFNLLLLFPPLSPASVIAGQFHICLRSHHPVEVTVSLVVLHPHPTRSPTLRSWLHLWLSKSSSLVSLKLLLGMVGLARPRHRDPTLPMTIFSTTPGCRAAGPLAELSRHLVFQQQTPLHGTVPTTDV